MARRRKQHRGLRVEIRQMSEDDLAALRERKRLEKEERLARRDRALEVLGTDWRAERAARRENQRSVLDPGRRMREVAESIDAGESASKRPSQYRRKIKRK